MKFKMKEPTYLRIDQLNFGDVFYVDVKLVFFSIAK